MYRPTYAIAAFMGRHDHAVSEPILRVLLEALVQIDMIELLAYPDVPPIYEAGVGYHRDARTDVDDDYQDAVTTWVQRFGDCEELAAWRAAELRVKFGMPAWLDFTWDYLPDGSKRIHIFVRRGDGAIEDPSILLMSPAQRAALTNAIGNGVVAGVGAPRYATRAANTNAFARGAPLRRNAA